MLYEIIADYRPSNPNKPRYYVIADSQSEAKAKFSSMISWLKIYKCEEYSRDAFEILGHPEKYIIIN